MSCSQLILPVQYMHKQVVYTCAFEDPVGCVYRLHVSPAHTDSQASQKYIMHCTCSYMIVCLGKHLQTCTMYMCNCIMVTVTCTQVVLHVCLGKHLYNYRSLALLGACAYNSTGRKYAPISEMRLITHVIIMTFLE